MKAVVWWEGKAFNLLLAKPLDAWCAELNELKKQTDRSKLLPSLDSAYALETCGPGGNMDSGRHSVLVLPQSYDMRLQRMPHFTHVLQQPRAESKVMR